MAMHDIEIDDKRLREICRDFSVRRLALFGSFQRGDFSDESDVDILVEFEAGARVGLAFFALQDELSQLLGRRVDLNTPGFLSPQFRNRVLQEAEPIYEAA
jgi:predicted nucleotidyltransferase